MPYTILRRTRLESQRVRVERLERRTLLACDGICPFASTPDLVSASDSGWSDTDNITNDTTPTFTGQSTWGDPVTIFANDVAVGRGARAGTYLVTTSALANGVRTITARADGQSLATAPSLRVTIDTASPTARIQEVTPDPRASGVSSMVLVFSERVAGFDLLDLSLTRGGGENLLGSAQRLVTTDNRTFTLQDVSGITAPPGDYVLTLRGAGSGITDVAGNMLAADAVDAFTVAPEPTRITQVFVNGPGLTGGTPSADHDAFRALAGIDAAYGFAVPAGDAQRRSMPWVNGINSVSLRFSRDVADQIQQGDLQINGANTAAYPSAGFTYHDASRTATWTLPAAVVNDTLRLSLDDASAVGLDGEWLNHVGTANYPSGDGAVGGDFDFRINVLAGDASGDGRVNALDLSFIKQRLNRAATTPGTGGGAYSVFADLTGDGRVNSLDLSAAKQRLNRNLPPGDPSADVLT